MTRNVTHKHIFYESSSTKPRFNFPLIKPIAKSIETFKNSLQSRTSLQFL